MIAIRFEQQIKAMYFAWLLKLKASAAYNMPLIDVKCIQMYTKISRGIFL